MSNGVLVHEWLARTGGSENVYDALVETFPDADLLCLWSDTHDRYPERRLQETWLARSPLRRHKALALPFTIPTWRGRPGNYEWALASTHLFAHHVSFRDAPGGFRKYVYVHSPARYIWQPDLDSRGASPLVAPASKALRAIDRSRAREIHAAAANSQFVRQRIRRAWDIDSTVIYPPVEVQRIQDVDDWRAELTQAELALLDGLPREFLLGASRLIPYKALDKVIAAAVTTRLPVVIAGDGPERSLLEELAQGTDVDAYFVGRVSDALLYALYQRCLAYVFPAIEDFGIMPVEAMAAGAPVICGRSGGVLETVVDGVTGSHVDFESASDLRKAIDTVSRLTPAGARARATEFSRDRFTREIRQFVEGVA